MSSTLRTGKETYLTFLPPLNPVNWPTILNNGFESLAAVAASLPTEFKPTIAEMYARDQAVMNIEQWTRQCKTTVSVTRGTEITDTSDDCNWDETTISKLVKSIEFEAYNRLAGTGLPILAIQYMEAVYESGGKLVLPVMWTNKIASSEGASGEFMISAVSDFTTTGAQTDANSLSVTLVPTGTPPRASDSLPMLNQFKVTRAAVQPADIVYYGEISRYDDAAVPAATITLPA